MTDPASDWRCAHATADSRYGRCQLWAGHNGPHALMFVRNGQRVVRCWTDQPHADAQDRSRGYEALPWMRGYPVPAWQESR